MRSCNTSPPSGSATRIAGLSLLFVLWGCGSGGTPDVDVGNQGDPITAQSPGSNMGVPDPALDPELGDDRWTTTLVTAQHDVQGVVTVTGFRAARHESFDRFVISFADGNLPTYGVGISSGPAIQCGSGEPMDLRGEGVLLVALEPAQAHDDAGNVTVAPRDTVVDLPALLEARIVCDFEGQVQWALGIADTAPFRVLELADPARLAIDIRH